MPFSQRRSRRLSISGGKHAGWSGSLPLCLCLALALAPPLAAQARAPRVALILDRDNPRFHPLIAAFEREIRAFFRPGEIELLPPVAGDGTASGVGAVLNTALRDPSVSVVVALGVVGSHLFASAGSPAKPSIAPMPTGKAFRSATARAGFRGSPTWTNRIPVGGTLSHQV